MWEGKKRVESMRDIDHEIVKKTLIRVEGKSLWAFRRKVHKLSNFSGVKISRINQFFQGRKFQELIKFSKVKKF